MSVQVVNIGAEVTLYNKVASSHADSEAPGASAGKNKLPAFKMINKSSLHHEFKQQKHHNNNNNNNNNTNNKSHNYNSCVCMVSVTII